MKKRILFFTENLYGGGVERISQIILSHFDYSKYDVTLYSLREYEYDSTIFSPKLRYKYVYDTISPSDTPTSRFFKLVKNKIKLWVYSHCTPRVFYRLFVNNKVDVAIAFIEGFATRIIAGAPESTKKIAWVHTDMINNHWTGVAYKNDNEELVAYSRYDNVICVSEVVKKVMDSCFGTKNKSAILYNPIDNDAICTLAKEPAEIHHQNGQTHLVSLGWLLPVKGYDRLIKVLARLIKEDFDIDLTIYGKGDLLDDLQLLSKKLNVDDRVYFGGFQLNPYKFLSAADLYVCSSLAEGFNTAITEALVLGKPVVSTECSGVREQLGNNNEWGICCENSEDGLYEGIKMMLSGVNLKRYTLQAKIRGAQFSLDASMKEIYKLIEG